jgi:hypothetical protein
MSAMREPDKCIKTTSQQKPFMTYKFIASNLENVQSWIIFYIYNCFRPITYSIYVIDLPRFVFGTVHSKFKGFQYQNIKDPVTHFFMVLYHKYDAQIKIYQYCKCQKALFIKILPNLIRNLFSIKSNISIRNECIYFNDYI